MIFAIVLQIVVKLEPCPLCILQRIVVILLGIIYLVAAIHNPRKLGTQIYSVFSFVFATLGGILSVRHLWLQHHPDAMTNSCGADLGYMLTNFPFSETLKMLFSGTAECSKVGWTFLSISIPGWTLIWFLLFIAFSIFMFLRAK